MKSLVSISFSLIVLFNCSFGQKWDKLTNTALEKFKEGDVETAMDCSIKAFAAAENDIQKASSAFDLGYLYRYNGDFTNSEYYYKLSLELRTNKFGGTNQLVSEVLSSLGLLYMSYGKYYEAAGMMSENETIVRKLHGASGQEYFQIINQLGTAYFYCGDYTNANAWYTKGLECGKTAVGENNLDYATNLNSLGVVKYKTGDFPESEKYLTRSKEIRKKLAGENSPQYSEALINLANVYVETGKYLEAEKDFISAANIIQEKLGEAHPEFALVMNNLADLYRRIGLYDQSEKYFNMCITAQEKTQEGKNANYARFLGNFALLYTELGENDKSGNLRLESLKIIESSLGTGHPDYATALNNLAAFYTKAGAFDKAEPLLEKARNMYLESFGENHPSYIKASHNLAALYSFQGKYKEAHEIYKTLEKKWKDVFGEKHPDYTGIMHDLALIHESMGETEKAKVYYDEMLKSLNFEIDYNFTYLTETEKLSYIEKTREKFDHFNLFVIAHKNQYPQLPRVSFENEIMMKGMSLKSSNAMRDNILESGDTMVIRHYITWLGVKKQLSGLYSMPASEQRDKDIAAYENYANSYEKELNRVSQEFRKASDIPDMEAMQQKLMDDEAAIEFITVKDNEKSEKYYALILKKQDKYPVMIELFQRENIEKLMAVDAKNDFEYIKAFYGTKTSLNPALYNLTWKPLEDVLGNIKTIYYAPAGLLHKVSFAAILCPDKLWLSEKFRLVQLTSTSNILTDKTGNVSKDCHVTVFGGVEFDTENTTQSMWKYLPGTKTEAENISKILNGNGIESELIMGKAASEQELKAFEYHSPCILHIATHGFFFPGPEESVKEESDQGLVTRGCRGFRFVRSDNPLMRSGIVLSGANNVWNKNENSTEEDGVLTAYEVSNLNFENTILVTLSACNTGLGDIKGSEGVYGLQRAFRMAGVKYLIISLWEVPDKETMEFMTAFYTSLSKGMDIPDAFQAARNELQKKYDAYYWAAFILIK